MLCKNVKCFDNILQMFVGKILHQSLREHKGNPSINAYIDYFLNRNADSIATGYKKSKLVFISTKTQRGHVVYLFYYVRNSITYVRNKYYVRT